MLSAVGPTWAGILRLPSLAKIGCAWLKSTAIDKSAVIGHLSFSLRGPGFDSVSGPAERFWFLVYVSDFTQTADSKIRLRDGSRHGFRGGGRDAACFFWSTQSLCARKHPARSGPTSASTHGHGFQSPLSMENSGDLHDFLDRRAAFGPESCAELQVFLGSKLVE